MDASGSSAGRDTRAKGRRKLTVGCVAVALLAACIAGGMLLARFVIGDREVVPVLDILATETPPAEAEQSTSEASLLVPTIVVEEVIPGDERRPGRISFVATDGQLGTVGAIGDAPRFLDPDGERTYLFPAWSPDGASIAALGVGSAGSGVYVLDDEEDSAAVELYSGDAGAPIYLYWRPDGNAVSYIISGAGTLNLMLSAADGDGDPQLLVDGQPLYWDWLDDQGRILVHTGTPQNDGQLRIVESANGPAIGDGPDAAGYFQAPVVSPDSVYLAFAELDGADRSVVVRHLASGEMQRTSHDGAAALSWSPNEQILAFISPDEVAPGDEISYFGPLRLFDPETGAVEVLVSETVLAFFWSPDGQTIAYFSLAPGAGEQVAQRETPDRISVQPKAAGQQEELFLNLSVVDVSGGQPRSLLDFRPTELFVTQFLPFFDQYALSHRLWSPDSRALVLPIVENDRARIYVVPVTGSGLRQVADGLMAFWSPR